MMRSGEIAHAACSIPIGIIWQQVAGSSSTRKTFVPSCLGGIVLHHKDTTTQRVAWWQVAALQEKTFVPSCLCGAVIHHKGTTTQSVIPF